MSIGSSPAIAVILSSSAWAFGPIAPSGTWVYRSRISGG